MAKHKLPRKSTHIDMTAMCDVAFLLLTFFMLATKFKPDEPVVVKTPSSISEIIMPENSVLLTVDPSGKVFFDFDNKEAKKILINNINDEKKLGLDDEEKAAFVNGASFGLPFSQMKEYLAFAFPGIPVDTSYMASTNELAYWVQSARFAAQSYDGNKPASVCIKCDASTPYPKIKDVVKSLTMNDITNFNLLTSLEAVPFGTDAYNEVNKPASSAKPGAH
jgi:biopolymer transport protein ExbD